MNTIQHFYLENNLFRFYSDFMNFEDYVCKSTLNYDFIFSTSYQWPGYVYNIKADSEICKELVLELEQKIKYKKLPPFLLVVQNKVPENIEKLFYDTGIKKIDYWPIIYLSLKQNTPKPKHPKDFEIVEISNENELILWYNIVDSVLFPGKSIPFKFFIARLNDKRYKFYLGYYMEKPVTTCMFFIEGKVAGAYMGSTLSEFRNKGFGTEIVLRGLIDSIETGCECATAQSGRSEFHVWEKIGFSVTNTIDIYWKLEDEIINHKLNANKTRNTGGT